MKKTKQNVYYLEQKHRLITVNGLGIRYEEIHIKQYQTVAYLGWPFNETLSGESVVLKVIKTKLILNSDFYTEKTGSCLRLFADCFITL